ncbi:UDP-N-acetylglucosamine 1-carboxyvinyltransferase [Mesoaciditoga lauensis]|uniref:UDP-N-acetylglucosamine 1-carboxyvinyltransferase n=1 Tax=Mesoaciditoga lauensis TaxID=1495039 RepID=UPI00055B18DF|nr:UDP-N-acetylglucosamine 1-carboxyvinyltransferase [Mesoaciditoga lauensis]
MRAAIIGETKVRGEVEVGGAKNASLPILAAVLVNSKNINLKRLPSLADVDEMLKLLSASGVKILRKDDIFSFSYSELKGDLSDIPSKIRASILLLGPLALKTGKAVLSYPGGCNIGKRPIDIHIQGLKKLGFTVDVEEEFIKAEFLKAPKEVNIKLPFPSVGATEHLMITSSMMSETTVCLSNCAMEPEIVDLQRFLNSMGAKIDGAGTPNIKIKGVSSFSNVDFKIMGDRIEAGTYIILSLIANGSLIINGIDRKFLNYVDFFQRIGAQVETEKSRIIVKPSKITSFKISTAPYPGFPTDLQPQTTVLACKANGNSIIMENIFENRFGHVEELIKMGAAIKRNGNIIEVKGPKKFKAARLIGKDLRETAAVTLAAIIAEGKSTIENFDILFRGYEKIAEKLQNIGVNIIL